MRRNEIITKILGVSIVLLFIGSAVIPSVLAGKNQKENETQVTMDNNKIETSTTTLADPQYYAVIVACSQYKNSSHNIPTIAPYPDEILMVFYNTLLESKNWNETNIILLLNQNATKYNITTALQHMADIVGPDDYFLFSWSGHGTEVPDTDGDEQTYDPNDTMDEAICPYDVEVQNHSLCNIIIDDELDWFFSNITCKGMTLIFECCLSGGMVDRTITNNAIHKQIETTTGDTFADGLKTDIQKPWSTDVNGNNRIVLMSTRPDFLELGSYVFGFPLITGLAIACTNRKMTDRNNDGIISSEEAFRNAKHFVVLQSSFIWIGGLIFSYKYYKFFHYPRAFLFSLLTMLEVYIIFQKNAKSEHNHYIGNFPIIQDNYPGEFPLFQISSL